MSRPVLLLTHGRLAQAQARSVASHLSQLGYAVGQASARAARGSLDEAHKVVLLWSRAADRTPALRAAARRAKAEGKLVCVQVDGAVPPSDTGRAVTLPRSRQDWRRLLGPRAPKPAQTSAIVARSPATTKPAPRPRRVNEPTRSARARVTAAVATPASAPARAPRPRLAATPPGAATPRRAAPVAKLLGGLAALALIAVAAGTEAYVRDPAFAARVNAMASDAQARASTLVNDVQQSLQGGG
ncbi:MAG: hypothetical protein AB7O98_00970 [Hyphomonadaceae bacterium]